MVTVQLSRAVMIVYDSRTQFLGRGGGGPLSDFVMKHDILEAGSASVFRHR